MYFFLIVVTALLVSMVIVPLMLRAAPRLGMVDTPGELRKVHTQPIARVGGWGIVLGALAPVLLWSPFTPLVGCFLFGAIVLLVAGAADDALALNHWWKFAGQFVAVIPVVYVADLYVATLPFIDVTMPEWLAKPITVVAMVGVVNALNHSDGLDGLAGGEALLSLGAITLLAWVYVADSAPISAESASYANLTILFAAAGMGGVLGFLRYNTHPARVFMGDTGSQFLGFILAFLVILLTQRVDTELSPLVAVLVLGMPVIDILAVLYLRHRNGMHLLLGSRNHIHHRLLDLGFSHYESVVVIYCVQAVLVLIGVSMCYSRDGTVALVYVATVLSIFAALTLGERHGFQLRPAGEPAVLDRVLVGDGTGHAGMLVKGPLWFLRLGIPLYLFTGTFVVGTVPLDFGIVSALLLAAMLALLTLRRADPTVVVRVGTYATVVFVVYLVFDDYEGSSLALRALDAGFFIGLAAAVGLAARYPRTQSFSATPMDFLVALLVLGVGMLGLGEAGHTQMGVMLVKAIVLLYACEILMMRQQGRWTALSVSAALVLACISVRGLFGL